jgi:hypothetical protein
VFTYRFIVSVKVFSILLCALLWSNFTFAQNPLRYEREPSFFSLPIEVPLALIEKKINDIMGSVLYTDDSYLKPTADDIKVKVYKNGNITALGKNDELFFKIPLKIWGQGRWQACGVCPEMEKQTIFDIEVFLRSKVEVTKDYAFKLTTVSDGFDWKKKPEISVGFVNVDISKVLEKTIQDQLKDIAKEIDKQVNSTLELRSHVQNIWNLGEDVFLIDDSTQTWLRMEPKSVFLSPVICDIKQIKLTLGIEAFVETFMGVKPKENLKTRLPDLIITTASPKNISFNTIAELPFEEATRLAKASCIGLSFGDKKRKVTITDIAIDGKDDESMITVWIEGKIKGKLTVIGKPVYSSDINELRFSQLRFDLESKNLLVKATKWLASETIAKKLEQALVFSFDAEVKSVKEQLDSKLKNYAYQNLFTVQGRINDFKVKEVLVGEKKFVIILNADGKAALTLTNIDF